MVKNIFGIFSSKPKEEEKEEPEEGIQGEIQEEDVLYAKDVLQKIIDSMGIMSVVKIVKQDEEEIIFDIKSDEVGRIIGRDGATLNALQIIIRNVLQRRIRNNVNLILDANNYRERRRKNLEKKAKKAAKLALEKDKEIRMRPMPSFDRRIVHLALEKDYSVETFSKGEKDSRRVVVAPKRNR